MNKKQRDKREKEILQRIERRKEKNDNNNPTPLTDNTLKNQLRDKKRKRKST